MSESPVSAQDFLYHAQDRLDSCWREAERIGMDEGLFRRLLHGWEETRLGLDYLEAAMRNTLSEADEEEAKALAEAPAPVVQPVPQPEVPATEAMPQEGV